MSGVDVILPEYLKWSGQGEVQPQVDELRYLGVMFKSEGMMESEIDRWIGAADCVTSDCINVEAGWDPLEMR